MGTFAGRSIGLKLLTVMAVPLAVIGVFLFREVLSAQEVGSIASDELTEINQQQVVGEFADAITAERSTYYDPTASNDDLVAARAALDEALEQALNSDVELDTDVSTGIEEAYGQVVDLRNRVGADQARVGEALVSGNDPAIAEAVEAYATLSATVLQLPDHELADRDALENLTTLLLLEQTTESLSIEGNLLSLAASRPALNEALVETTETAVGSTDESIRVTLALGEAGMANTISSYLAGDEWNEYQELRDQVIEADEDEGEEEGEGEGDEEAEEAEPANLDSQIVQTQQRAVIDRFDAFEDEVISTMITNAEERSRQANNSLLRTALLSLALLAVIGAIVLTLYRAIRTPLLMLEGRADEIASTELPELVRLMREEGDLAELPAIEPIPVVSSDEVGRMTDAFNRMHFTAVRLAAGQAASRSIVANMFVNLGRRNQKLLMRMLSSLAELEKEETDPDRLEKLYGIDHLATRMRRNAESLLVLADAGASRRFEKPVPTSELVRSAISEVEDFRRVKLSVTEDPLIGGDYVADLTHLLAELLENALKFSSPNENVEVIARYTRVGYILAVVDRGLGLTPDEIAAANQQISAAARSGETPSKYLGLFVVGRLAARHGMNVELFEGVPAGLIARVRIPKSMIASEAPAGVVDNTRPAATEVGEPQTPSRYWPEPQPYSRAQPQAETPPEASPQVDEPATHVPAAVVAAPPLSTIPSTDRAPSEADQPVGGRVATLSPPQSPDEGAGSAVRDMAPPMPPTELTTEVGETASPEWDPETAEQPTVEVPSRLGVARRVAGANLPAGIASETKTETDEDAYRSSPDEVASNLASFQRGGTDSPASDTALSDTALSDTALSDAQPSDDETAGES